MAVAKERGETYKGMLANPECVSGIRSKWKDLQGEERQQYYDLAELSRIEARRRREMSMGQPQLENSAAPEEPPEEVGTHSLEVLELQMFPWAGGLNHPVKIDRLLARTTEVGGDVSATAAASAASADPNDESKPYDVAKYREAKMGFQSKSACAAAWKDDFRSHKTRDKFLTS